MSVYVLFKGFITRRSAVALKTCGAHKVHMASSTPEGPPELSGGILLESWAAEFIVICTNQTISLFLEAPAGHKQIKSGMRELFVSPGLCGFPFWAKTKTFSCLSHLSSSSLLAPGCFSWNSHVNFYLFLHSLASLFSFFFIVCLTLPQLCIPNYNRYE